MPENENIPHGRTGAQPPRSNSADGDEPVLQENSLSQAVVGNTAEPLLITEQQAPFMEVHHHPNLHHKPKPWKEYFLEFIMIFLAVTLGFFAENFREHLADGEKEKEAVHALVEDLESDTAYITPFIALCGDAADSLDEFVHVLNNYKPVDSINHRLYTLYPATTLVSDFNVNDRTLVQLKSTGSMHYIKNKAVADELVTYDDAITAMKDYTKIYEAYSEKCVDQAIDIFNLTYFKSYVGKDGFDSAVNSDTSLVIDPAYRNKPLPIRSTDVKLLTRYANSVWGELLVMRTYRQILMDFKKEETTFLELLHKQYK